MYITRSKVLLFFLTCCLSYVTAQSDVPKVRVKRHALLDAYVYGYGGVGAAIKIPSLFDSDCELLQPLEANIGAGIGFHMPNGKVNYMLFVGYQYLNLTYRKHYDKKGISLNYLNIDARINFLIALSVGLQSKVRLSSSLPPNLPLEYIGYDIQCFNPITLRPYICISFPATSNLSFDFTIGYQFILFNKQSQQIVFLNDNLDPTFNCTFEFGVTYRIFTSGKRQP